MSMNKYEFLKQLQNRKDTNPEDEAPSPTKRKWRLSLKKKAADNNGESGNSNNEYATSYLIANLETGAYFGEVALITNLKRTATVKALDFCTLSSMSRNILNQAKEEYPTIYVNFRQKMRNYEDFDFVFRRKMIKNVPYFRKVDDAIIEDISYLMKPKRYEAGTVIVKRGDIVDSIMLLKCGEIVIEVPYKNKFIFLDKLNEGSCFCAYSAFAKENLQQVVNFRATTTCIIESVKVSELKELEKNYL